MMQRYSTKVKQQKFSPNCSFCVFHYFRCSLYSLIFFYSFIFLLLLILNFERKYDSNFVDLIKKCLKKISSTIKAEETVWKKEVITSFSQKVVYNTYKRAVSKVAERLGDRINRFTETQNRQKQYLKTIKKS